MIENDFGVAFPDPRNVHVSHLDAAQPENQILVEEGVLSPAEKWRKKYRFAFISLACSAAGFLSIFLSIIVSMAMLNDSGSPLADLGLTLFVVALIVSFIGMMKDRSIGPPWFAFAVSSLPLLSVGIFTMVAINATAAAVGS